MAFHVGQKVVCIKQGAWTFVQLDEICPVSGQIYTIRGFDPSPGETSLLLEEIVNEPRQYRAGFYEASFLATRFRPVVERKTSIAIFTALLNPINHKHLEGV